MNLCVQELSENCLKTPCAVCNKEAFVSPVESTRGRDYNLQYYSFELRVCNSSHQYCLHKLSFFLLIKVNYILFIAKFYVLVYVAAIIR